MNKAVSKGFDFNILCIGKMYVGEWVGGWCVHSIHARVSHNIVSLAL